MDVNTDLRESCRNDHMVELVRQGVIEATHRAKPAEQICKGIGGCRRHAGSGSKIPIFNYEDAARPQDRSHFAETRYRVGQVQQQESAVNQVERLARQARMRGICRNEKGIR
jgi:hypothetical protein